MLRTFGDRISGLTVDGTELHAAVFNENQVRAAAGLTLVIGAVAFSFAYFDQQYVPLQVASTLFFVEFLTRVTFGIRYSPVGIIAGWMTSPPAAGMGLGEAEALRLGARARPGAVDDDHHQQRHHRHAAEDALRDLHGADVDGVGARPVRRLRAPRLHGATRLDDQGSRLRGLRRRGLRDPRAAGRQARLR